jgi:hypothetical protein
LYNFTAQISHDFTFAHGRHVVVVLVAVVVQCRGVFLCGGVEEEEEEVRR